MLSHFSHIRLFATPWTVACQASLSVGFSRQEHWSGYWSTLPPSSRASFWPRDQICVSYVFCISRQVLYLLALPGSRELQFIQGFSCSLLVRLHSASCGPQSLKALWLLTTANTPTFFTPPVVGSPLVRSPLNQLRHNCSSSSTQQPAGPTETRVFSLGVQAIRIPSFRS